MYFILCIIGKILQGIKKFRKEDHRFTNKNNIGTCQISCARPVHALAVHRHSVGVRVDRVRLLRHGLASQRLDGVLDAAQRIYKSSRFEIR